MQEKVIETKTCRFCSTSFDITDKDLEFYDKVSPTFSSPGLKYSIPSPTLCPDCRQQRRLSFRNERNLYKRKCDLTGKDIISMYSPDKPYKVYEQSEWWSDKWNPMDYSPAGGIDFGRSFFEQFEELMREVPLIGLFLLKDMENSDYCNFGSACKDSYLSINSYNSERSFYSHTSMFSFYDIDGWMNSHVNNSYYSQYCNKSLNVFYSQYCNESKDIWYCIDCKNCENCIGSANMNGKKYCVFNKEVDVNTYENCLNKLKSQDSEFLKAIGIFLKKAIRRFAYITSCENCTGDNIQNSKNVSSSYDLISSENVKYCYLSGYLSENMYDGMNIGGESQYIYEAEHEHWSNKCSFVLDSDHNNNCLYISHCHSSSHLFGCIGLRNAQYCVLNKQYTKEEYESLVPRIIEHMTHSTSSGGQSEWGEFFPSSISPFGYNETVAIEYYPINPNSVIPENSGIQKGVDLDVSGFPPTREGQNYTDRFKWSTYENPAPIVSKTIPASKLPDNIKDIPDDILNWAIKCEITGKPFRIIKQELEFYRKHNLPIPRRHPDQRHLDRMKLRNPRKLYDRLCDKCGIEIKTTYNPDREEIVYCEECYLKEVV